MIFVTTGSRSFQFNRLLEALDIALDKGYIRDQVFAQIGGSDYKIRNYVGVEFLNHDEFNQKLKECDVLITHGGTGVIVNAAKMKKRIIAVPRLQEYGEAVDNHQIQLVKAFEKLGIVIPCWGCTDVDIANALKSSQNKKIVEFQSNTQVLTQSIRSYINSFGKRS